MSFLFVSLLVASVSFFNPSFCESKTDAFNELLVTETTVSQHILRKTVSNAEIIDSLLGQPEFYPAIITENEWKEIDGDRLLQQLDCTITSLGKWGLKTITRPLSNKDLILKKQAIIKQLVDDASLRLKLENALKKIKETEQELFSYWYENEQLQQQAKNLYFSTSFNWLKKIISYLNHSKVALNSTLALEGFLHAGNIVKTCALEGISIACSSRVWLRKEIHFKQAIIEGLKKPFWLHYPFPNVYENGYDPNKQAEFFASGSFADMCIMFKHEYDLPMLVSAALVGCFTMHQDWMLMNSLSSSIARIKFLINTVQALHKRTAKIAQFFKAYQELASVCFNDINVIHPFCCDTKPSLVALKKMLQENLFQDDACAMYSTGSVLFAHQMIHENKDMIIPMLKQVAVLDGYVCAAKNYVNFKNKQTQLCYVEFTNNSVPLIELHEFWTPLMPQDKAVCNSLLWGIDNKMNIILTGPNGGGKSTIMKAIMHALILAHSWGVAPALRASMSCFTMIMTAFDPKESLKDELSSFMAEKKRMDSIVTTMKTAKTHDKICIMCDEPFKGTVALEAENRIWKLGHEVADNKQNLLMIATHLEKPTQLEKETKSFTNFQMDLWEKDGKFTRTFKLIPGRADWWFKDIEKRMRYIDQLLAT